MLLFVWQTEPAPHGFASSQSAVHVNVLPVVERQIVPALHASFDELQSAPSGKLPPSTQTVAQSTAGEPGCEAELNASEHVSPIEQAPKSEHSSLQTPALHVLAQVSPQPPQLSTSSGHEAEQLATPSAIATATEARRITERTSTCVTGSVTFSKKLRMKALTKLRLEHVHP